MKFEDLWDIQSKQQSQLGLSPGNLSKIEKIDLSRQFILGLFEEISELSRESGLKNHVLGSVISEKKKLVEESVDIFKYLLAFMQLNDINPVEFIKKFEDKTVVITHRAEIVKKKLEKDVKLICLDLDGCIADLSELDEELESCESDSFAESIEKKEKIKHDWRVNGKYSFVPMIHGSKNGLNELMKIGYKIAIITSRPYRNYKGIYGDTVSFLKYNNIRHDLLLFERDKAEAITKHISPAMPKYFIEDRLKHAIEITSLGIEVLLLNLKGDDILLDHPLIKVFENWENLIQYVKSMEE